MAKPTKRNQQQVTRAAGQHPPAASSSGGNVPAARGGAFVQMASWQGPLPPPEDLQAYKAVMPDAPERVFAMAERQAAHRQALEARVVKANTRNETLGMLFAFVLGLVGMGGGIFLLYNDKQVEGFTALLGTLVALVGAFIAGRRSQQRERERRGD